jgi:hypothetical protein
MRWKKQYFLLKSVEQRKADLAIRAHVEIEQLPKAHERELQQSRDAVGEVLSATSEDGFTLDGEYYLGLHLLNEEISGYYCNFTTQDAYSVFLKRKAQGTAGQLFPESGKL